MTDEYECYDCGETSTDPETKGSRFMLRVTCPHCGAVDEIPQETGPIREPTRRAS